MPKVSPLQSNFSGGEFSPRLEGRVDIDRYQTAMKTCLNYIPTLQGDVFKRSGTYYIAETETMTEASRLVKFEFSVEQAYILEFGNQYIRFYRDNGQITSGGSPYQIATPYLEADLFELQFVQSADVLFIVHPDYQPRTLERTAHTSWTLNTIAFLDGPYIELNTTATTITPSATSGNITLTASSISGINGGAGFQSGDVGRSVRIEDFSGNAGYANITAITSTTVVDATVIETLPGTGATGFWRIGLYSDTTGYPAVCTFHEDRLTLAGVPDYPQRMDMSETGRYTSFRPAERDGSLLATNAVSFTFAANDVNVVRWLLSDEKGMVAGTVGGEWIVRPSSTGEAITPSNVTAKRSTTYGSANVQPAQVGKSGLFLQRAGKKIREITYYFDVDGFRAIDLTLLAEHITGTGIVELEHQKEPQPVLWAVRSDGVLAGLTYERDIDSFKAGWHRHIIGGSSDAAGTDAKVESIAVIPSSDGKSQELWMIVQRYIDGSTVRYVEYMKQPFDDNTDPQDAFFVDSGLTYDNPLTISGATKADPCVLTVTSHGLSDGDKILVSEVLGMTELNTNSYLINNSTTNTFELQDLDGNDIDSSAFTTYVSGGEVRKYITSISGLDHLEGESVTILGDGAVQPNQTVSSGAITLATNATTVHIGIGYNADGKLLRFNAGAADGTALGKTRRTHRVGFLLHRSLGLQIGMSFDDLTTLTFRTAADEMSRAPALFTGITSQTIEADYDFENEICFRSNQPLPSNILAIMPQMHTQDR